MPLTPKYALSVLALSIIIACHDGNTSRLMKEKWDVLLLSISFAPSFNESAEITLISSNSTKDIQILLRDDYRADKNRDTFYFKKIDLRDKQYAGLDSALIRICRQKLGAKYWTGCCDGMIINSRLLYQNDTNHIAFRSPDRKTDSIGYFFSESLFAILRKTFQDTVISEYLDDIETYVDDSKFITADPNRKIDQMRMRKYQWTIKKR